MANASGADGPGRWRQWIFRLPLRLSANNRRRVERMVARIIGIEWIALDTIGRRSGRTHRVLLDVVGRDPLRDVYYVQPAYGRRADWVRNVTAHPAVTAHVGGRSVPARVRQATGAEGADVVLRFIRAHPRYARLIVWFVGYVDDVDRPDADLRQELQSTLVLAVEVDASASL